MHHPLKQDAASRLQPAVHRDLETAQTESALAGKAHLAGLLAVLAEVFVVALANVAAGEHPADVLLPVSRHRALVLRFVGRGEALPVLGEDALPKIEFSKGPVGDHGPAFYRLGPRRATINSKHEKPRKHRDFLLDTPRQPPGYKFPYVYRIFDLGVG